MKRLTQILLLTISLIANLASFAQTPYVIDVVCLDSERHYRVDGEAGSSYTWMLTDPAGIVTTLPETADTVTIQWNMGTGIYLLSTIQHDSLTGCDGLLEVGTIEVIDGPVAFAGTDVSLCIAEPYVLATATASNYSQLLWTTTGDGTFDDATILNPKYAFGPNDIINGTVTLILTAQGLGNAGSCPPVASSVIITLDNLQVSAIITPASCPAVSDGIVELTASGGTPPYSYTLNAVTNATGYFDLLAAGDYIYYISDNGGCSATDTVTVGTLPAITATVDYTPETYLGADDGTITVHAQGGSGSYEYSIDDLLLVWQPDSVFTGLTPGFYNIYVRDSLAPDCWVWIIRVEITTSPALVATYEHTDITCFGYNDGTITFINPQNGSGFYEFSIDNGNSWSHDLVYTGLIAGNYPLWIRDSLNPVNTQMLGIVTIVPAVALTATLTVVPESAVGAGDGQIIVTAPSGGTGSYEYSLDGITWQSSPVFSPLAPGDYTVIMRDSTYTYCQITLETVTVPAADALYAKVTVYDITCFGANDGRITLTDLWGGSGSYEFTINGGSTWQSDSTFSGLVPGTYSVTMRDSLQITNTVTYNNLIITEPGLLAGDVTFTAATCANNDGTITVHNTTGGSGFYLYSINGFSWQADTIFYNLAGGSYNVFIRDSLSQTCEVNLGLFAVLIDCPLSATVDTTAITCFNAADGSITISNPQGGSGIYEYSIDAGLTWSTTMVYTNLGVGTDTVMMRDATITSMQVTLEVVILTNPPQLSATVIIGHETIPGASDGSLTITAPTGGSGSYEYSLDNINWQASNVFAPLAPGDYTVYIRDLNNIDCYNALGPYTVLAGDVLYAETEASFVTCFGTNDGSITITNPQGGSGTYEYSIDGINWQLSNQFSGLPAGMYTIRIRDINTPGNVSTLAPVEVVQPEELSALVTVTPINCNGATSGIITFNTITGGSGNYEFSIDEGLTWQPDSVFSNLGVGQYIVMLRDSSAAWCYRALDTVNLIEGSGISVAVRVTHATCASDNGVIFVMADGGVAPLEYILEGYSTWQSNNIFPGLPAGTYTVNVRDAAGCEQAYAEPVIIEAVPVPVITEVEVWNSTDGLPNAHIVIHATGGTPPLLYSIDGINWQSSPEFYNLSAGLNFTAYVKDANDCITTAGYNIGNLVIGTIELTPDRVQECNGEIKALPIRVQNFDSVASFRLQLSYDDQIINFEGIGYINNMLVSSGLTTTIVSPGVLQINYQHPGGITSVADNATLLELDFRGLSPGLTNLDWEFLECVVYVPTVGFAQPVKVIVDGFAEVVAVPEFTAWQDGIYCTGDSTILHAQPGNEEELTFEWTHPRGIKHYGPVWNLGALTVTDSGYYMVEARNENCFSRDSLHVTVYPSPDLHISYTDTLCFGNPVILDPGGEFTQYEWNDGSSLPSIVAYEAGIYWVKVVDYNGCRAIDSVELVPCILEVLIPNAFTPNGDGLNDDFEPIFRGFEPKNYRMDIYSKWGQLIYTTTAIGRGWDGRINGELVPPDTFVYSVSYEVPSYVLRRGLTSPIKGSVTVVR
ncbi:MAG TPA: T9SS type B sorting domain-containing protein [Lentimicrobium sp.]|nr:T9SS type B sorting domain-containing protein [Lentimicrobium sp.]